MYQFENHFSQLLHLMANALEFKNIHLFYKLHYYIPIVKVILFMCFIGGERIT